MNQRDDSAYAMLWTLVLQAALQTPVGERHACAIHNGPSFWIERQTIDTFVVEGAQTGQRIRYALSAIQILDEGAL